MSDLFENIKKGLDQAVEEFENADYDDLDIIETRIEEYSDEFLLTAVAEAEKRGLIKLDKSGQ